MAKRVLTNAFFSFAGNDLSAFIRSATLDYAADEVEDTTMAQNTHTFAPDSLKDWTITIQAANDQAAAMIDALLFPLVGTTGVVILRPDAAAVSTSNPNYTATGLCTQWSPFSGGNVGELHEAAGSFRPADASNGTLVRATA